MTNLKLFFKYIICSRLDKLFICMTILFSSIIVHFLIKKNYYNIALEIEKCPFCYGKNLCALFDNNEVSFANLTWGEKFRNMVNMKNVYLANFNHIKVVLKKLGHSWELANIDNIICKEQFDGSCPPYSDCYNMDYTSKIMEYFVTDNEDFPKNIKLCSLSTINQFMNKIFSLYSHYNISVMTANIWTIILANSEPLLLQILDAKKGWPVPTYYGACGRVVAEEYCGIALHYFESESWILRAKLAVKILKAADDFTYKHPLFRFYLTDISSDNIVVTNDFEIKFIDLENVIINEKHGQYETTRTHESNNFYCDNCYAFSSKEICAHSISDHNFYSVCKLILSRSAPWPMMENGLLHSAPVKIVEKYAEIFKYIEICTDSSETMNRFEAAKRLTQSLQFVISEESHNFL